MVMLVSFFFLLDFVVLSHCAFSAGKAVPCWFGHLWEYFWILWIALIVLILKAVEVIVLCVAWILFVWYCWWGVSWASLNLAVCFDWLTVTASDSSFFFSPFCCLHFSPTYVWSDWVASIVFAPLPLDISSLLMVFLVLVFSDLYLVWSRGEGSTVLHKMGIILINM